MTRGLRWLVFLMTVCLPPGVHATSVTLAWDYAQGADLATQFRVYSQVSSTCTGIWGVIATVAAPIQSYTDGPLSSGLTYCYRVTALDVLGLESPPSNVATFQMPTQRPAAPSNLRGTIGP